MENFAEVIQQINENTIQVLKAGTICELEDWINPTNVITCTIKMVEPDEQMPNIVYYYIIANNDELNTKTDPRFPWRFYDILPAGTTRLRPIAGATNM